MRPIDADALKKNNGLEGATKYGNRSAEQQNRSYSTMMLYEIAEMIDGAPTIDAKPIVHAHWIEETYWYHGIGQIHCTCSNCGYTVDYKPGSRFDGRGGKFCDDCGAKMDGGAEND